MLYPIKEEFKEVVKMTMKNLNKMFLMSLKLLIILMQLKRRLRGEKQKLIQQIQVRMNL